MFASALGAWRQIAIAAAALLFLGLVGGAFFIWSGIYNVSAARDHFAATTWLLAAVRDRSVATHSAFIDVPEFDTPDNVRLGGAHFEGVCAACHPRPGKEISSVVAQMLPPPPHLSGAVADNTPREVFWVVKHGLKYTGMPAFPAGDREDEVWAVTAFVLRLARGSPAAGYRSIAGLDRIPDTSHEMSGEPPMQGTRLSPLTQCIRCHDDAGISTHSGLVPRLSGQSANYLRRSLMEYAAGNRPSGIMQPVADALTADEIERLASYYSELPVSPLDATGEQDEIERGRRLAESGDVEAGIPACLSCHGTSGSSHFPDLAGQNAAYIMQQLKLWREGGRSRSTYGQIMAVIARRLSASQAREAAQYFQSLQGTAERRRNNIGEGK